MMEGMTFALPSLQHRTIKMVVRVIDVCVVLTHACSIVTIAIGLAYCGVYLSSIDVPKPGDGLIAKSAPMALETAIAFVFTGFCLFSLSVRLMHTPNREDLIATNTRLAETVAELVRERDA